MNKLDNSSVANNIFIPKEGQRELLSSNRVRYRCPSFGVSGPNVSEDVALDYLASILVEAFLNKKEYERNQFKSKEKGSALLPSINKRTS